MVDPFVFVAAAVVVAAAVTLDKIDERLLDFYGDSLDFKRSRGLTQHRKVTQRAKHPVFIQPLHQIKEHRVA